MRRLSVALAVSAVVLSFPAVAATITQTYDFNATGFVGTNGSTPPFATANGSFTVTYDNAANALNQAGVTIHSISLAYAGPVHYSYYASDDTLAIVSANYNPSVPEQSFGRNGFAITLRNVSTSSPIGSSMNYSVVGYDGVASTRTVAVQAAVASAVPEPATWGMMVLGFGAIGGAVRRRRKVTARLGYA